MEINYNKELLEHQGLLNIFVSTVNAILSDIYLCRYIARY